MYRLTEVISSAYVIALYKDLSTYLLLISIAAFKSRQVEPVCGKEL